MTERPALRFLLSLVLAAVVVVVLHEAGVLMDLRHAVVVHALVAVVGAAVFGLAKWWRWAALLFAPLIFVATSLAIPPWIWPVLLLICLGLFAGVLRSRVPLYLSNRATWTAVEALLPAGPIRIVDVGAGLGGLMAHLARRRPDATVDGIEIAPMTWLLCWLRLRLGGSRARVRLGDLAGLDLAAYDVVFAFLSPEPMPELHARAQATMRPGTLMISCEFEVAGCEPDERIDVPGGRPLLVWRIRAR